MAIAADKTVRLQIPRLHRAQQEVLSQAKRYNILACGRRFGKTLFGEHQLVDILTRGYPAALYVPNYKTLTESWRSITSLLKPLERRISEADHRVELMTGGVLDCWSLDNPDASRGRAYARIVVDEAAQDPNLAYSWENVIRGTLVDYTGDAWFQSTPKGLNYFWRLWTNGQDSEGFPHWKSWKKPTSENPLIPPEEIEEARLSLPEAVFRQEYLAEFIEGAGGVFRRIREAASAIRQDRAVQGHQYVIGVDWGKLNDFTVCAVVDLDLKALVAFDRMRQIDYLVQVQRLRILADKFKPRRIIAEKTGSIPLIEGLQRLGLPVYGFNTTNESKRTAIESLGLAFEKGEIKILRDEVLLTELEAYQAERLPSGLLRYTAPEGMHDDCVMALAMAWQGVADLPKTAPFKVVQPRWTMSSS